MPETSSPSTASEPLLMIARVIAGCSLPPPPAASDLPSVGACGFALPADSPEPCFAAGAGAASPLVLSLPLAPQPASTTTPTTATTAVAALIRLITQPLSRGLPP
jgi:hypothetical protein